MVAGALALLFPETRGEPLQETMEESEVFGTSKLYENTSWTMQLVESKGHINALCVWIEG